MLDQIPVARQILAKISCVSFCTIAHRMLRIRLITCSVAAAAPAGPYLATNSPESSFAFAGAPIALSMSRASIGLSGDAGGASFRLASFARPHGLIERVFVAPRARADGIFANTVPRALLSPNPSRARFCRTITARVSVQACTDASLADTHAAAVVGTALRGAANALPPGPAKARARDAVPTPVAIVRTCLALAEFSCKSFVALARPVILTGAALGALLLAGPLFAKSASETFVAGAGRVYLVAVSMPRALAQCCLADAPLGGRRLDRLGVTLFGTTRTKEALVTVASSGLASAVPVARRVAAGRLAAVLPAKSSVARALGLLWVCDVVAHPVTAALAGTLFGGTRRRCKPRAAVAFFLVTQALGKSAAGSRPPTRGRHGHIALGLLAAGARPLWVTHASTCPVFSVRGRVGVGAVTMPAANITSAMFSPRAFRVAIDRSKAGVALALVLA